MRRGSPSVFAQYIETDKEIPSQKEIEYAKSMGICIGDIGFFIAMDICNKALQNHEKKEELINLINRELIIVGLAQMDDITFAASETFPSIEEVLRMYLYKTAHYTFSLPLSLGAMIAEESSQSISAMEKLGEEIGLIFQIRDDEIGLTADEEISGKPLGSDIRENKKTIIRLLLEESATQNEKEKLATLQKKKKLNRNDITLFLKMIEKYHIPQKIKELLQTHQQNAEKLLNSLDISNEKKVPLHELISFVITRKS